MIHFETRKKLKERIKILEKKLLDEQKTNYYNSRLKEQMITESMMSNSELSEKNRKLENKLNKYTMELNAADVVRIDLEKTISKLEESLKVAKGKLGGLTKKKNKLKKMCDGYEKFYGRKKPEMTYENMKKYNTSPKKFVEDERNGDFKNEI